MPESDSKQYLILLLVGAVAMVLILLIIVSFSWYFFQKKAFFEQNVLEERNKEHELRLKQTIEQEETERLRIARDLHDDIGGLLSTTRMHVNFISASCSEPTKNELAQVLFLLDEGISKLRNLSKQVAPPLLHEFGLVKAVDFYISLIKEHSSIEFCLSGNIERFDSIKELLLFRVIQEMLTNAIKHGRPNKVIIDFQDSMQFTSIEFKDNGVPFNYQEFDFHSEVSGSGLRNIANRLENCQAKVVYLFDEGYNVNRISVRKSV
jgi:signal transduction histidine kinase